MKKYYLIAWFLLIMLYFYLNLCCNLENHIISSIFEDNNSYSRMIDDGSSNNLEDSTYFVPLTKTNRLKRWIFWQGYAKENLNFSSYKEYKEAWNTNSVSIRHELKENLKFVKNNPSAYVDMKIHKAKLTNSKISPWILYNKFRK